MVFVVGVVVVMNVMVVVVAVVVFVVGVVVVMEVVVVFVMGVVVVMNAVVVVCGVPEQRAMVVEGGVGRQLSQTT